MSKIEPCRICGKPGNLNYTVTTTYLSLSTGSSKLKPSQWKYFCSKECNYRETWKQELYASGLALTIILILIAIDLIWWFVIGILMILAVYSLVHANFKRTYWMRDDLQNEEKNPSKSIITESDDEYVYSDILQDDVLKCCYQSARLSDKYCVCGRALEYPSEVK